MARLAVDSLDLEHMQHHPECDIIRYDITELYEEMRVGFEFYPI